MNVFYKVKIYLKIEGLYNVKVTRKLKIIRLKAYVNSEILRNFGFKSK
ncbi:hypothetical protein SAMN02927937_00869 [Paenimyroides aquimaris]|uniref:Uncharacterized protein n=1 Tax=Paenimyroides marinum TaxID=1159016 RepID=A0A1H6K9Q7_9FLAO|nr:hypothetical protein SAMN02927937_00869 [Paenimyroides aquimaris]